MAINFVPVKNTTIISEKLKPKVVYSSPTLTIPKKKKIVSSKPRTMIDVEKVPIYPGCEGLTTNAELRQCMSKKIGRLIQRKFNTDLAESLGLTGKQNIYVQFKIDKSGNISEIKASTKHIKL